MSQNGKNGLFFRVTKWKILIFGAILALPMSLHVWETFHASITDPKCEQEVFSSKEVIQIFSETNFRNRKTGRLLNKLLICGKPPQA